MISMAPPFVLRFSKDERRVFQQNQYLGRGSIGDVVSLTTSSGARVTWIYAANPEASIIQLQLRS
jgi:hypothetical protein